MAVVDQQPMSLAKNPKNLRLKFSKIYSVGKLFRISFHLKIEPACNFQIKSKPPKSNFFFNRKFIRIFKKFRRRPHKFSNNQLFQRTEDFRRVWLLLLLLLVLVLVLAMVGFFFFFLSPFSFFWKCIWNYTAPSSPARFLYQFSKVIFNGISG